MAIFKHLHLSFTQQQHVVVCCLLCSESANTSTALVRQIGEKSPLSLFCVEWNETDPDGRPNTVVNRLGTAPVDVHVKPKFVPCVHKDRPAIMIPVPSAIRVCLNITLPNFCFHNTQAQQNMFTSHTSMHKHPNKAISSLLTTVVEEAR
eukprot:m.19465 g.19465  ORF g.19465 m.19465 type:complete len:149 (-) comp8469_c0_seq2:1761-2207(-)